MERQEWILHAVLADMRRFGIGMLTVAVVLLVCIPYWALLGLPLRS